MQHKKKLLIGSLSVSAIAAGVALTGGTSAYYYDLERSTNNSFSACSLDLVQQNVKVVQTEGDTAQATGSASTAGSNGHPATITLSKLQPGDAFKVTFDLVNQGSCAGELWADVNFPIKDLENGFTEPEDVALDTSDDVVTDRPSDTRQGGELDDYMEATFHDTWNDYTGTYHQLAYRTPDKLNGNFGPSAVDHVTVNLKVPEGGVGEYNDIMTDSFTFAIDFALGQKGKVVGSDLNVGPEQS